MAEARLLKSELATDVARGEYREQSRVRFDAYAREWARTYQGRTGRGIRPTTLEEYRRDLELHVIPTLGRRRLSETEPRHVKSLARDLAERGLSPGGVRVIIARSARSSPPRWRKGSSAPTRMHPLGGVGDRRGSILSRRGGRTIPRVVQGRLLFELDLA